MAKVEIYTTPICPYCHAAKALLADKGVDYVEKSVVDPEALADANAAETSRAEASRAEAAPPPVGDGSGHGGS